MKKKLPALKRLKGKGGRAGNFYSFIDGKKVDLATEDATAALKNLRRAVRTGARDFTPDGQAAAVATIDVLTTVETAPPIVDAPAMGNMLPFPPAPPAPPELRALPPIAPEAPPAAPPRADWATEANAAAAASEAQRTAEADAPPPGEAPPKLADVPWLAAGFVTVSKLIVTLQLRGQEIAARYIADVDLGPVGPPPKPAPQSMEEFQVLLEEMAQPWGAFDPREPGRLMWESVLRRMCPESLPIPDWLQAPALVALFTLPVQLMGMKRAKPSEPEPQQEATTVTDQATAAAA